MEKKKQVKCAGKAKTAKRAACTPKKKAPKTTVPRAPKKSATKTKKAVPAKRTSVFAGASEVSVTDNKIIVTREVSKNRRGRYQRSEVREYIDKTPANMAALNSKLKNTAAKKITVKFKG